MTKVKRAGLLSVLMASVFLLGSTMPASGQVAVLDFYGALKHGCVEHSNYVPLCLVVARGINVINTWLTEPDPNPDLFDNLVSKEIAKNLNLSKKAGCDACLAAVQEFQSFDNDSIQDIEITFYNVCLSHQTEFADNSTDCGDYIAEWVPQIAQHVNLASPVAVCRQLKYCPQ